MTMQLEDRLWEQLEAAADREAARGRPGRSAAAARAALPARRLRGVAGLALAAALVALVVSLVPERELAGPQVDRFAIGGSRIGAAVAGDGALWAHDTRSGAVLRIDPRTRRVTARLALPAAEGDVALAASAGAVWAVPSTPIRHSAPAPAHPPPATLLRIDPRSGRVEARIVLRAPGGATLLPVDVVAQPGAVWVWGEGGALRVDPAGGRVTAAITQPGERLVGFAATESRVVVASDLGAAVNFRARDGVRLSSFTFDGPVGRVPLVLAGQDLVLARRGGVLTSTEPASGVVRWKVALGRQPRDVAVSGGRLWVLLGDELRALDPGTGRLVARVTLPSADGSTLAAVPGGAPLVLTQGGELLEVRAPG